MSIGDNKHLRDEFIKKCSTRHPDGWEGAVREYAEKQNAIYEEWQRSITDGFAPESSSRFLSVVRYFLGWFRKR